MLFDSRLAGIFPMRARTKTRFRLVRGGDGSREMENVVYCLCSAADAKMTIRCWNNKSCGTGARSVR